MCIIIVLLVRNVFAVLVDSKRYHEFMVHATREAVIDAQRTVAHNFYRHHHAFQD